MLKQLITIWGNKAEPVCFRVNTKHSKELSEGIWFPIPAVNVKLWTTQLLWGILVSFSLE